MFHSKKKKLFELNAFKGLVEFERETIKFNLSLYTTQSIKSFIALTPLFVALKN